MAEATTPTAKANHGPTRIGLQLASALILCFLVTAVTAAGGWCYYRAASDSLRGSDRKHAERLARALAMAAQYDLRQGQQHPLQRLVGDFLRHDNVRCAALLDSRGTVVASASRGGRGTPQELLRLPVAVCSTTDRPDGTLLLAQPIVMRDVIWFDDRLVGAVRVVFDTTPTIARLRTVMHQMFAAAGVIVFLGIPLGYLLVWRLIVRPIRCLVAVTVRLARGDYSARASLRGSDEAARLAAAFNAMADEVERARARLLAANEDLERRVAGRTRELEAANGRLRQETAEKNDFLRAVSHDLNAPLRNIGGMASLLLLKWRAVLPEEVVSRLERIAANVDHEAALIAELLELSRIQTRPQRRCVVDMGELIADVAATFDHELRDGGIELTIERPMPALHVEPSRMRQVFQNLIDNAVKYMDRPEGGRIRVSCRHADGAHDFAVSDNGPGIPPDQLEKVFYIFRRGTGPQAARVAGKGVGLALVRTVAARYEGRAWADSAPGQGATFHVTLADRCTRPPPFAQEDEHVDDGQPIPADCRPAGR